MTFHLPKSNIVVLQGNIKKISLKLPSYINWINWKDRKISQKQILTGSTIQDFIKKMYKSEIIDKDLYRTIQTISNYRDLTHRYIEDFPSFIDSLQSYGSLFEIIELYLEKQDFEEELHWAKALELKSKADVGMKRISILTEEIEELEKKLLVISPQYEFLKKNEEVIQQNVQLAKDIYKKTNKTYITKTGQVNKLKRKIDAEKPKSEIYSEKLEELEAKFSKNELLDNSDYIRLTKKSESADFSIQEYEEKIATITQELLKDKSNLKINKTKLAEIKLSNKNSSQKFNEVGVSYENILRELEKKKKERDLNVHNQVKDLSSSTKKDPPDNIRFSSIIAKDLESINIRLSKFLDLSVTSPDEYITELIKNLGQSHSNLKFLDAPDSIVPKNRVSQFLNIMNSIESSINSLLDAVKIRIILSKLPLIDTSEEIVPKFGIHFEVIRNDKNTPFEKLSGGEKVLIMWMFECVLNSLAGMTTHVFSDANYKIKRTKKLLQNLISFMKKEFLSHYPSHKIILILSKPILEDIKQEDIVITTI